MFYLSFSVLDFLRIPGLHHVDLIYMRVALVPGRHFDDETRYRGRSGVDTILIDRM